MSLIKNVRQRRRDKIRSIVERSNAQGAGGESEGFGREFSGWPREETKRPESTEERGGEPISGSAERDRRDSWGNDTAGAAGSKVVSFSQLSEGERKQQADPELAWKRNPNPWESWSDDGGFGSKQRSYVVPRKHAERDKQPPRGGGWRSLRRELKWKLIISLALFAAVWGIFQLNHPLAQKGQAFVKHALEDELNFAAAANWYKAVFAGSPAFIPIFDDKTGEAVGVEGSVKETVVSPLQDGSLVKTFAELLSGIEMAGPSAATVEAIQTGRVIQVTEQKDSVIVQHENQRLAIYGNLGDASVKVNDWVEAGDAIGRLKEAKEGEYSLLYFAIKQHNQYIDPLGVIPID